MSEPTQRCALESRQEIAVKTPTSGLSPARADSSAGPAGHQPREAGPGTPSSSSRRLTCPTVVSRKWKIEAARAAWRGRRRDRRRAPPPGPRRCRRRPTRSPGPRRASGDRAQQREVVAAPGAVAVHAGEQDLARRRPPPCARPTRPRRSRSGGARRACRPPSGRGLARRRQSIATTRFALPIFTPPRRPAPGSRTAAVMIETLSAPALSRSRTSCERAHAAADRERHEHALGRARDRRRAGCAAPRGSR